MTPPRSRLTLIAAALAVFVPLAASADDIPGTDFSSGLWSGRAWADDTGKFVDCYFGVTYTSGEVVSFSLARDDTLSIFLSGNGAKFTPGKSYPATLLTEVGYPVPGQAFGTNESYVGFTLEGIDASIDYLTQGAYLRLLGVGIDQAFDVRGLGGALAQARACHTAQTGGATASAADTPTKPAKPGLGSSGNGTKPAQMAGEVTVFKRQHMPCKDDTCK